MRLLQAVAVSETRRNFAKRLDAGMAKKNKLKLVMCSNTVILSTHLQFSFFSFNKKARQNKKLRNEKKKKTKQLRNNIRRVGIYLSILCDCWQEIVT